MIEKFLIAQIGRTVGLWGDLKITLHTDFPEQFQEGERYETDRGELTLISINYSNSTMRFAGYEDIESAKKLTNAKIYSTKSQTKANCKLEEGQHFWFEILGCRVIESGELLGVVKEISRIVDIDYLEIETDAKLIEARMPKSFLIPYIPRYIICADMEQKSIETHDAKEILEAS